MFKPVKHLTIILVNAACWLGLGATLSATTTAYAAAKKAKVHKKKKGPKTYKVGKTRYIMKQLRKKYHLPYSSNLYKTIL